MHFDSYQEEANRTAIYPHAERFNYLGLGVGSEAGEILGVMKKVIRDNNEPSMARARISEEVGDLLWYCSQLLLEFGISFDDCALENLKKLKSRQARHALHGDGDHR
jgi:NTP pyrophosphatase (non-canonical NTP hydrolase)